MAHIAPSRDGCVPGPRDGTARTERARTMAGTTECGPHSGPGHGDSTAIAAGDPSRTEDALEQVKKPGRPADDGNMATGVGGRTEEQHISGLYVGMLLDSLADRLSTADIRELLAKAGETRTLEELSTSATWSSYPEFKRLLQEAKLVLDACPDTGLQDLRPRIALDSEIAGTIQAFGSPGSVLATNTGANPLVPIRRYETTEVGPQRVDDPRVVHRRVRTLSRVLRIRG